MTARILLINHWSINTWNRTWKRSMAKLKNCWCDLELSFASSIYWVKERLLGHCCRKELPPSVTSHTVCPFSPQSRLLCILVKSRTIFYTEPECLGYLLSLKCKVGEHIPSEWRKVSSRPCFSCPLLGISCGLECSTEWLCQHLGCPHW